MSKIIRWGILGTGKVAQDFALGLKVVSDAKIVAVGSRNADTAQRFAQKFNIPKTYTSYESLVADPDIDVVYIATPQLRHKQDALLCLNAGKSILCEKPFMLNAKDAQEVIQVARDKKLFCMEAMWMRFIPLMDKIKALIEKGGIGNVLYLTADFGYPVNFDPDSNLFSPPGGGALLDRGIYLLSLASYLFGQPDSITSQASLTDKGVDEQCSIILNYANGLQALLFATFKTYGTNEAVIIGDRGKITIKAPFYCPFQYSLTKFQVNTQAPTNIPQSNSPSFKQKIVSKIKENFQIKSLYLRLKNYQENLLAQQTILPYEGNGYNYEAIEVNSCLKKGQLESSIMPLDETLAIMKMMDQIRQQFAQTTDN